MPARPSGVPFLSLSIKNLHLHMDERMTYYNYGFGQEPDAEADDPAEDIDFDEMLARIHKETGLCEKVILAVLKAQADYLDDLWGMRKKPERRQTHDGRTECFERSEKVVDGLVEVFDGLAQMFAGVSEQLDMLAANAKTEDELELPVAEQPVLPVTEKKGPAVSHPRKKPVKKTKKVEETVTSAIEETAEVPVVEDPDEAEKAVNSESSETAESEHPVDDADALPWEEDTGQKEVPSDKTTDKDTPAAKEETQSAVTITKDEITAVIVAKIKKKRDNNEKIGQLLKTYGVAQLSDLPAEKYEAFLADVSQI